MRKKETKTSKRQCQLSSVQVQRLWFVLKTFETYRLITQVVWQRLSEAQEFMIQK